MRILVVEDHAPMVASLFAWFEARGHVLDAAPDGITGLHLAVTQPYDVVLLDWMLPRLDGPGVLARLREAGIDVPVLLLTARGELPDKITGFRAGADDYLTKPYALAELEVRIDAVLARTRGGTQRRVLEVADLRLDLGAMQATRGGRVLQLYPAGRKLLEALMRASPDVVPRARLEQVLWGDDPPDGDMLRSHMHELRRGVDAGFPTRLIHTVPRTGYRLAAGAAP